MPHYDEFKVSDTAVLQALIESFPFATITANGTDGTPVIASAPLVFQPEPKPNGSVHFHLANSNPVIPLMQEGAKATIIVHGPNCPISPSWYKARFSGEKPDRSKTAPTQNFVNAVMRGTLQVLDDSHLSTQIGKLVKHMESPAGKGWQLREIDPVTFKSWKGFITGFRLPIEMFDLTVKISQEQNPADWPHIVAGLKARGGPQDISIARMIEENDGTPQSLIRGLQAISPTGNATEGNTQTLFRRLALEEMSP